MTPTKVRGLVYTLLSLLVWLLVWQISAVALDREYFLPAPVTTFKALLSLISTAEFYRITLLTLTRVLLGISLGVIIGTLFAVLSHSLTWFYHLVRIPITVVRSTPVASFIIILWILLSGDALAVFVAILMVAPIVWQNLLDGYSSIDKELIEVTEVFGFSKRKRFLVLTLPALKKYFLPAVITSVGLGWKAEIAAEIIAYTKNSIGQKISDAKYNLHTAEVFAWTLVIIFFSIALEWATRTLLRRFDKRGRKV